MNERPLERWIVALDIRDDGVPPAVTMRRILKHLWRRWGVRCRGFSEDEKKFELMVQVEKLRKIIDGLAARVAAQSELLSKRAEKKAG